MGEMKLMVEAEQFFGCDLRVGVILSAEVLAKARVPAYRMEVDFGPEIGVKQSSGRLTARYAVSDLVGRKVIGVVNLPARRIAGFKSEVLILGGLVDGEGGVDVALLAIEGGDEVLVGTQVG